MKESDFFRQPAKVLEYIRKNPNKNNVTKISKMFKANYGNILKAVNKLERLGLIKKEKHSDNRQFEISLTRKGKRLADIISKVSQNLR